MSAFRCKADMAFCGIFKTRRYTWIRLRFSSLFWCSFCCLLAAGTAADAGTRKSLVAKFDWTALDKQPAPVATRVQTTTFPAISAWGGGICIVGGPHRRKSRLPSERQRERRVTSLGRLQEGGIRAGFPHWDADSPGAVSAHDRLVPLAIESELDLVAVRSQIGSPPPAVKMLIQK